MPGASSRRPLYVAAIVGLGLRLAFGLLYWVDRPMTRDEREYLSLARSLAAGHGFVYDHEVRSGPVDPFGRAPGYPLFLAAVGGGRGVTAAVPVSVKIAQAVVGACGVFLVGLIGERVAGRRAGVLAATIAAIYPPLVWTSSYAFSEALAWPLGLFIAWLFDGMAGRASRPARAPWARALVCGALGGLATLIRPAMILFFPLAALWLAWRRQYLAVAALALGSIVVIAPWTARNYSHYGRFVLVASEGGVTFWTGNHPRARGEGDLAANPELKRESQALKARHPELSEEQMEPVYYREALDWIKAHPLDWLTLELRKVFYLVVPIGPSYAVHSTLYYAASLVSYLALLPFAALGFWTARPAWGRIPGLWILGLSSVAVCLVFFPQERFRIPVIDPLLIVCASAVVLRSSRGAVA